VIHCIAVQLTPPPGVRSFLLEFRGTRKKEKSCSRAGFPALSLRCAWVSMEWAMVMMTVTVSWWMGERISPPPPPQVWRGVRVVGVMDERMSWPMTKT
jgi:hypothetical protein